MPKRKAGERLIPAFSSNGDQIRPYSLAAVERILAANRAVAKVSRRGKILEIQFRPLPRSTTAIDGWQSVRKTIPLGQHYTFPEPVDRSGMKAWSFARFLMPHELLDFEAAEDVESYLQGVFRAVPLSVLTRETTMLNETQKAALEIAIASARACQDETGCPAELAVAQWALESGWGSRQPGNNCFGIKACEGDSVQLIDTWEVEAGKRVQKRLEFAAYESLTDCFHRHGTLIAQGAPYRKAFAAYNKTRDLTTLIQRIAPVYATDPDYANKLLRILAMPNVKLAFAAARTV